MSNDRDEQLVQACLDGNRKAFEVLVERYEKKLYNAAYRVLGDRDDAMDATQSAFVKAYEKLDTFNPSYRFFSWIYRILMNESLNIVHQRKRFDGLDEDIPWTTTNPEQNFADNEKGRHIASALLDMPTDYRVVIVMKHFQGFSYREMSEIIGIPEKTVKSRLFSARRQLRDLLIQRGFVR
jgi:RNA polymerase sigma-70 factor (ECF subfamily)